ncbi:MAG: serine/threonine protein kinase [Anaerolineae bacterium]|nr:serine/threonine protein kinase [Anaerolineae bacterium]
MTQISDIIQPGEVIGPYKVVNGFHHGRGGQARVYKVEVRGKYRRPDIPKYLALKVAHAEFQAALVAEAAYLSRFDHRHVVRIYPVPGYAKPVYYAKERFTFGERWYYAMELVEGNSLDYHLTRPRTVTDFARSGSTRQRPLSILEVIGIAQQLTDALDHIHAKAIVNLDVKPGNILFRRRRLGFLRSSIPEVVLVDFGIARDMNHPRYGELGVATPEYMSPEQSSEMLKKMYVHLDERSDIFSLGVVLYEMLTGKLPFENLGQFLDSTYTPPAPGDIRRGISRDLEHIVMRALAQDPRYRYQTGREMRAALTALKMPLDWGAVVRRTCVGSALTLSLLGGGYGLSHLDDWLPSPTATPTPSPTLFATSSPSPTQSPTSPPPTLQPTSLPSPSTTPKPNDTVKLTVTSAPSSTPTNTPYPATPTITPRP